MNPAGYIIGNDPLRSAITQVSYTVIEMHVTTRYGLRAVLPVCKGWVYGFWVFWYYRRWKPPNTPPLTRDHPE